MAKPQPAEMRSEQAQAAIDCALRTLDTERSGIDALTAALRDGLGTPFAAAIDLIRAASGRAADLLEIACRVNDSMPDYVVGRVVDGRARRSGPPITDARIVVLGVTYKAGIPDVRQSAALTVAYELARRGGEIVLVDPVARDVPTVEPRLTHELVAAAAAVVVLVAHPGLDYTPLESAAYVFDATGSVEPGPHVEIL